MGVGLWDRLREAHLKFVAAQGHLLVVRDEVIEGVEDEVVRQEELGGPSILPGVDPAVLDLPVPPEGSGKAVSRRPEPQTGAKSQGGALKKPRHRAAPQEGAPLTGEACAQGVKSRSPRKPGTRDKLDHS